MNTELQLPTSTAINQFCQLALQVLQPILYSIYLQVLQPLNSTKLSSNVAKIIFECRSQPVWSDYRREWRRLSLNVAASQFNKNIIERDYQSWVMPVPEHCLCRLIKYRYTRPTLLQCWVSWPWIIMYPSPWGDQLNQKFRPMQHQIPFPKVLSKFALASSAATPCQFLPPAEYYLNRRHIQKQIELNISDTSSRPQ